MEPKIPPNIAFPLFVFWSAFPAFVVPYLLRRAGVDHDRAAVALFSYILVDYFVGEVCMYLRRLREPAGYTIGTWIASLALGGVGLWAEVRGATTVVAVLCCFGIARRWYQSANLIVELAWWMPRRSRSADPRDVDWVQERRAHYEKNSEYLAFYGYTKR